MTAEGVSNLNIWSNSKHGRLRLNIGGSMFQCLTKTLEKFPDSKLARLNSSFEEYDEINDEYFFDRNPFIFGFILDAYRYGSIHLPKYLCGGNFKEELEFWDISPGLVAPCCWEALYKAENDVQTIERLTEDYKTTRNLCILMEEKKTFRNKLWLFLDEPKSSRFAMIWSIFMGFIVIVSTLVTATVSVTSVLTDTLEPERKQKIQTLLEIGGWSSPGNGTRKGISKVLLEVPPFFIYTDVVCFAIFTLEVVASIMACPYKRRNIFTSWLHMSDIICSISFWITVWFGVHLTEVTSVHALRAYIVFGFLTVLKLVRLFRIIRHVAVFNIMGLTFRTSGQELKVVCIMICLLTTVFGTVMYTFEFLHNDEFENVYSAMYWALITMTTVGYGDYTPSTVIGHVIASACAVCGVLVLALPIGVIASSFNNLYSHHKYALRHIQDNKSTMTCEHQNDNKL